MSNSLEFGLRALELELRRVAGIPQLAGGAPMSAEFTLERILEVARNLREPKKCFTHRFSTRHSRR